MANCPSCNAEVPAGTRWCSICHTNVMNQGVGRLAMPGKRLGAYILDLLVPIDTFFLVKDGAVFFGIALFLGYVIWTLMLYAKGITPGKMLLGVRVIKEDGTSAGFFTMLIRELVGKAISGLILSLGFLWVIFDRDNQGWHDKLMSTYVVE